MNDSNTRRLSPQERLQAALKMNARHQNGDTVAKISRITGITRKRLYQLEEAYNKGNPLNDKPRPGRPTKSTPQIISRVIRSMMNDPSQGSKQIKNSVNMGLDLRDQISDRTVRRLAIHNGLYSRRPAFKPPLTRTQMTALL